VIISSGTALKKVIEKWKKKSKETIVLPSMYSNSAYPPRHSYGISLKAKPLLATKRDKDSDRI
jgi:hypothetical protein